ncbi:hypothetical protein C4588_02815 [Candidatus Parcubacteria bacterium]|nr:MAG: hypothetical protein C4588_02815 [Candidatus Parcubacteria bacterium]
MYYRRNADESLREAERAYLADRSSENRERYRLELERAGMIYPTLEWGYKAGLPLDTVAAWGARAILTDNQVDIVYASRWEAPQIPEGTRSPLDYLLTMLDSGDLARAIITVKYLVDNYAMQSHERQEFLLHETPEIAILGNTNASHGYLYLVAFIKPPNWKGPAKWVAPPPPPPPPPMPPPHAQRVYNSIFAMVGIWSAWDADKLKPEQVPILIQDARAKLKGKTGAKTVKSFLEWTLAQDLSPETKAALQAAIQELFKKHRRY